MVCLKEDFIVVLPTGFSNSVIYSPEHSREKNLIGQFDSANESAECNMIAIKLERP